MTLQITHSTRLLILSLFSSCLCLYQVKSKAGEQPAEPAVRQAEAVPDAHTATQAGSSPSPEAEQSNKESPGPAQAAAEEKFDLWELRIKGNHLLLDKEIERMVYPFLGPQKTIETVENARAALENLYRNKGYQTVSVDIPEQDVINGIVNMQVNEGKVSQLKVIESRYFSLGKIKESVPEIAEGKVPNFPVMQKQIEEFSNKSPDRSITPILRAGDTPGTLEVDLKVKDELPLHGRVELNGRNAVSTTRLRLVNSIHYDNLWQLMHSASLMYQVAPENSDEVDVWAGTYAMPLPFGGTRLAVYAISSSSNASLANAGALAVVGIGEIYGLRLIKPLPGLGNFTHSLTLGADYKDFREDLRLIGNDSILTPISYLPFLVEYNSSWFAKSWQASLSLGLNFHIRGVGGQSNSLKRDENGHIIYVDQDNAELANDANGNPQGTKAGAKIVGEFENKRAFAKPNYAYLTADANFIRDLPYEMQFAGRFSGQVADSPLISNEQFSLGGMESVRGYFETQALADDGFTGSLELRSPRLAPMSLEYIDKLQAILFADGGYGRVQQALPGNPDSYALASAGFGLRFQVFRYLEGILDLGFPLIRLEPVIAGHPKLHFSIAAEF